MPAGVPPRIDRRRRPASHQDATRLRSQTVGRRPRCALLIGCTNTHHTLRVAAYIALSNIAGEATYLDPV